MKMVVCSDAMLSELARPKPTTSTEMTSARMTLTTAIAMASGRNVKATRQII